MSNKLILSIVFLCLSITYVFSQKVKYTSTNVLYSERDKTTGLTTHTEKMDGTATLKLDITNKIAILTIYYPVQTFSVSNLTYVRKGDNDLYVYKINGKSTTILINESDKLLSYVVADETEQAGYVLQNFIKTTINSMFDP